MTLEQIYGAKPWRIYMFFLHQPLEEILQRSQAHGGNAPLSMEQMLQLTWRKYSRYRGGNAPDDMEEMLQSHGAKTWRKQWRKTCF
jgi:hypothetical protein